jgi:hypothetical protein
VAANDAACANVNAAGKIFEKKLGLFPKLEKF